tara:strand:- start:793 stop:981 length:189 start_codon:yes stop_codon:yes gene_type:complete
MYNVRQEDQNRYVVYKGNNALYLPCKMIKKKKVEFSTREEAEKYIEDVDKLIKSGEEYLERY